MAQTIDSIGRLERHEPSGMFYNWYDPATREKLRTFPESGDPIKPFLSSVDNGWLATGLLLAARAEPSLAKKADAIRKDMNFGCYYNEAERQGGQIRGGFWDEDPNGLGRRRSATTAAWARTSGTPATTTAPSTPSRGSRRTSASPPARSRPSTTTAPSAPSPTTTATGWTETKPVGEWKTYRRRRGSTSSRARCPTAA